MNTSPHMTAPRPTPRRRAFTLIELLTVIGIIVIILGVTIPAFNHLMRGNGQKQAVNTVTAYLASARATALNYKRPVGLAFFEDPNDKNQTAVVLVGLVSDDGTVATFDGIVNRNIENLPRGIKATTLQGTGTLNTDQENVGTATPMSRVILFDGAGQLLLRTGLGVANYDANADYLPGNIVRANGRIYTCLQATKGTQPKTTGLDIFWRDTPINFNANSNSCSSPAIMLYGGTAYQSAAETTVPPNDPVQMNQWLQRNADLIVVNSYTGNVIR